MSLKEKIMRRSYTLEAGGIPSAKSSSSTLDSTGTRRISMLPEPDSSVDSQAIDVERAIALLQELKKTASPNELVALHRALLPTKEVDAVTSPRASPLEEQMPHSSSPPYQRRSHALPPGLATRGGYDQDLLRRPEDAWTDSRRSKPTTPNSEQQNPLSSVGSFAALDLANDKAKSLEKRPTTPADFDYGHMGGWGNGALRVTNGAASPEPSIEPASEEQVNGDNVRPSSSPARPSLEGRRARASIDVLPGRMGGDKLPLRDHNVTPTKPQLAPSPRAPRVSGTSLSSSADSPIKRTPPSLNTNVAQQLLDRRASVSPLSDLSTPGSTHRQNQRASDFSAEYMTDRGLTSSPYEDRSNNTLLNFASRLSTVYDSDTDNHVERRGTPEAALLLLEGGQQPAYHESRDPFNNATTAAEGQASEAPTQNDRPPPPKKADSGYGSDASLRHQPLERTKETKTAKLPSLAQGKNLNNVEEKEETDSSVDSGSMYTFEEMLKAAPSDDVAAPSQPPQTGSKPKTRSPFLRLKSEKRSSAPNILEPVNNESKTIIYTVGSAPNSPSDSKKGQPGGKGQKKLQKPMPQAMKKQRKEEMLRHQESSTASLPNLSAPNVPAETSAAHARRLSSQPGSGSLDRTYESRVNADTPTQTPPVELDGEATRSTPVVADVSEQKESPAEIKTKDRGRKRSQSVRKNSNADEDPVPSRGWSISNLRNRSHSRGRSQAGKRSSVDIVMGKTCMASDSGSRPTSPGDENVPAYSDFSSVARALGGGSYDISTNQFKRSTAPVPSSVQHQLQSPWAISTGLAKAKQSKGMTPEMASEFARARSKDFANADKKPWQEQPRMVFPSLSKTKGNKKPYRPSAAVEDFFPDWQSKPASRDSSAERPQPSNQKFSMPAETIPPLPELPADVGIKASRADQIVAKKLRSSPGSSARNSADLSTGTATSGKKRSESLKRSETAPISNESPSQAEEQPYRVLHSAKSKALRSNSFDVQTTPQNFSHPAALRNADGVEEADSKESAKMDQQAAEQNVWAQQANFWRQRRQTLGDNLQRPAMHESRTSPPESLPQSQPSQAPNIVVSRYVTPLASENAARANAGHQQTALDRANSYRGLLVDEKENRPAKQDVPRTDSAVATPSNDSFVTVKSWTPSQSDLRPAKRDIPRTDSATSTQTYTTTSTTTTTSSTGRGRAAHNHHFRTPSGKFVPYSPSKESMTERSRARSQAPTNAGSSAPSSTRKPLRDWLDNSSANTSTSTLGTPGESSQQPRASPNHFSDRYSGGLDYGWERAAGFQGSAGTRSSGCSDGNRKSVQMSEQFGVDLSDVPVFLQKIRS
ncbi:hypothetical protein KC356_g9063 [Hortaea werneckii]|nr:hypothetical protein KC356_g9063 [Hortaea werneckii]